MSAATSLQQIAPGSRSISAGRSNARILGPQNRQNNTHGGNINMLELRRFSAAWVLAATTLLSGCLNSDDSPSAPSGDESDDEAAIEASIGQESADYADSDLLVWGEDSAGGTTRDAINTLRWWRELLKLEKSIDITIHRDGPPSTADVTVTTDASGVLHLVSGDDPDFQRFNKDFEITGVRSLFFERRDARIFERRGWVLKATSGVEIQSPATTRNIHSVRVQSGSIDVTYTNVTDLVALNELLRLPLDADVAITVDTGDASDSVFLHLRKDHVRWPLESNGDGTFSGKFRTGLNRGLRHFAVDVLSQGTLFDDTAPYDNVIWGIPFVVRGQLD